MLNDPEGEGKKWLSIRLPRDRVEFDVGRVSFHVSVRRGRGDLKIISRKSEIESEQ